MFGLIETGFGNLTLGNLGMLLIGALLIWGGIAKKKEPLLLVPIGFGAIIVNLPLSGLMMHTPEGLPALGGLSEVASGEIGLLNLVYHYGLYTKVIPLLIFLGVGTMMDFQPTIARPISLVFGAAAQLGVFIIFLAAYFSGFFTLEEAASVAMIGGSDGPPTVFITVALAPHLLGPITMIAYAYMALVPLIQPPVIRSLTTQKERAMEMNQEVREVSKGELILFPILVFLVSTLLVPGSAPLIGMLMFGNLLRVSGVTERLAIAGSTMNDMLLVLLGLCVGALMPAQVFFDPRTLLMILLAIFAFVIGTAGGVITAKILNLFIKDKINPIIGAAGVSAVPMAARVAHSEGLRANPNNYLIMHALGPNMAGAISTSVVAGVFLGMIGY